MGLEFVYSYGQSPLEEEEKEGLIPAHITKREQLDEFEQNGIETAMSWILSRNFTIEKIFTQMFIKDLHRRMFSDVWKWAGEFRRTNKNIGVDKFEIAIQLKQALDDALYWVNTKSYDEDEIAVRLSHRIVKIHPFANGNGRHSRLFADVLITKGFNLSHFTWGSENLIREGEARKKYLDALRQADQYDYIALIKFARS